MDLRRLEESGGEWVGRSATQKESGPAVCPHRVTDLRQHICDVALPGPMLHDGAVGRPGGDATEGLAHLSGPKGRES